VVARGRLGQSGGSAGLPTHRSGGVQILPRGRPYMALRCVMDLPLRQSSGRKSEALPSALPGTSSICPTSEAAEPRGTREALCRRRLPRYSRRQESVCCEYKEDRRRRNGHRPQCVCRQRGCAWGVATAGQSSFSQLKLSENRRKHFSSPTTPHIACNVRRQCSPTVRMVG
jgi:hypothetical protein